MIRLVLDRDGKKLEALKSIRKQLQVAWVKDDSCLKRGMWLLNRHLLLNDCVCLYIYTQIHFMCCSRIGPFQWHLLISSPPTHSELLSHLLLAPQRLTFLARILPVSHKMKPILHSRSFSPYKDFCGASSN